MTKNKTQKVSAIDAIIQPFQIKSKSTQTHSDTKEVRLGGTTKTVSVFKNGKWESVTRVTGGTVINASHRIRTGKTVRDRASSPREAKVVEVAAKKKK